MKIDKMEKLQDKKTLRSKKGKEKQAKLTAFQKKILNGPTMTDQQWKEYLEINPRAQKWKI